MVKLLYTLLIILICSFTLYAQKITVSGYVSEKGNRESLIGVNVYLPKYSIGTTTNAYGFYSITVNKEDTVGIIWSFVGYQSIHKKINLQNNQEINIELNPSIILEEVVISGIREKKVSEETQMSTISLKPIDVKNIPALLGEKDVFKALQLMPGVQKGSEGSSGLYVRGGGPDQNLIILDEAVVYNANHLFGFFSLFNGDALKSIELTKGGFPARYGGRLSSVIDMTMKDGNKEKFSGEAGIGIISSRLLLEGPIVKNKSSFIVSGRRTYIDILMQPFIQSTTNSTVGYYFYDLNAKINYDFGNKNKLFLSAYFGRDKFYMSETGDNIVNNDFYWQNVTATLRWNHLFSNKIFSNTSLIFSDYTLKLNAEEKYHEDIFLLNYKSGIRDFSAKFDVQYLPNTNHQFRLGLNTTYHIFTPSAFVVKTDLLSENIENTIQNKGIETAVYIEDDIKIRNKLKLNPGLRISGFSVGDKIYINPEPRLSVSYLLKKDLALKASFASMSQYLHLLSNTGVGLPTDLWVPATENVKPQKSWQIAGGLAKDIEAYDLSITLEGYYKKSDNIIGYREGSNFLLIDDPSNATEFNWEKNVTSGQAWSYGCELLVRKTAGRFSGWIGYTLSWTQLQFDELNFGMKYYARYDRRHDISVVGFYSISENITLSATWVYGTGNAITMPKASYSPVPFNDNYFGRNVQDYGDKNSFRMAPYHRFDIGIQFHKKRPKFERIIELSLYNAYNRKNPFFYYLTTKYNAADGTQKSVINQVTLFPIIPSISWSIKF
ncbi:MAG: TonB-dependent receptor [Bacteroidales bacterium]